MKRKFATRYLLPLEMYMGVQMFSWGVSGVFGSGTLWGVLASIDANVAWGAALCVIGGVQVLVTGVEWFRGRAWPQRPLYRSVSVRCVCAFLAACVWIYVIYLGFSTPGIRAIFSLMMQAPMGFAFAVFAFYGNSKIQCVLDPTCPTDRLENELMRDRRRALGGS